MIGCSLSQPVIADLVITDPVITDQVITRDGRYVAWCTLEAHETHEFALLSPLLSLLLSLALLSLQPAADEFALLRLLQAI